MKKGSTENCFVITHSQLHFTCKKKKNKFLKNYSDLNEGTKL